MALLRQRYRPPHQHPCSDHLVLAPTSSAVQTIVVRSKTQLAKLRITGAKSRQKIAGKSQKLEVSAGHRRPASRGRRRARTRAGCSPMKNALHPSCSGDPGRGKCLLPYKEGDSTARPVCHSFSRANPRCFAICFELACLTPCYVELTDMHLSRIQGSHDLSGRPCGSIHF
jgi:hypothetical protein